MAHRLGIGFLALGSVAAGLFDLLWGEFERAHQPIQALGDHIPAQHVLACIAGVWLIAAGLALLGRRTARGAAIALAAIYLIFALFWVARLFVVPRLLGFRVAVFIGLFDGLGTQLIVVVAAALLAQSRSPGRPLRRTSPARWIFGASSVAFGLGHLTAVPSVGTMIPAWMPLSPSLWVVLSGVAFLAAGLAILSGILDALAAQLLALMLLLFSLLVLLRLPVASPHEHVAWGSNAYNLAAVGAALIFAAALAPVPAPPSATLRSADL